MSIIQELKRRSVIRVGIAYIIAAWLVAQVLQLVFESFGAPDWVMKSVLVLLVAGLPFALFFAWAFELTPDGVVRAEAVAENQSSAPPGGRKLDVAIVLGLLLIAAILVWRQLGAQAELVSNPVQTTDRNAASIAVLPFADLSPQGDQEYFSDGIAEEILNVLVRVEGLEVSSRTSSFQFKDADLGLPEIARALQVRHIVEGSVRKSGDTIRITAQLIDALNDTHLWSDTYDRPLTTRNVFEIQDDIASSIVSALSETLGIGVPKTVEVNTVTDNLTAYELYLRARPLYNARMDLDQADEFLAGALAQDPEFAGAWGMRAAVRMLASQYGYSDEPLAEAYAGAQEFASRALQLNANSALAIAVESKAKFDSHRLLGTKPNLAETAAAFDRALELDPQNLSALIWRGLLYKESGHLEAALADFATCKSIDQYYSPCVSNHFLTLAAMGRDDEALRAYDQALSTSTDLLGYPILTSLARLGEEILFKAATNDSRILRGWHRQGELYDAYRNPGRDYGELIESLRSYMAAEDGIHHGAVNFIAQPLAPGRRISGLHLLWDATMQGYRQTDAFKDHIRNSGIYDYWQDVAFPPQCKPVGNNDFECA